MEHNCWATVRASRLFLLLAGLTSLPLATACDSKPKVGGSHAVTSAARPTTTQRSNLASTQRHLSVPTRTNQQPLTEPYPPARWRLAALSELDNVMLWVSHILIRHAEVADGLISFQLSSWTAAPPAPTRSRQQAFQLASALALRLNESGHEFAPLARQYSEDVATRDSGGSLGGITAAQLLRSPEVLDALAALKVGQISRVLETPYGFHIFVRHPPPAEQTVSGVRLVIGHDDARWLHRFLARRAIPSRSRSAAYELAKSLYQRAQAEPEKFDQLIDEYTEHEDALRDGDFGAWSTRRPTPFPRAVQVLTGLKDGEIHPPIDSLYGYQIIQRTPNRQREEYAMQLIQQPFDPNVADGQVGSKSRAYDSVLKLSHELHADPSRFDELRRQYCCRETFRWVEGQGSVLEERALNALNIGQISTQPARLTNRYALLRRLKPVHETPPEVHFELPSPKHPDMNYFAERATPSELHELGRELGERLGLSAEPLQRLVALHQISDEPGRASSGEARLAAFSSIQKRVEQFLDPDQFREYRTAMYQHVEAQLLSPSTAQVGGR